MFKYNNIVEIASVLAENNTIPKEGLTVVYELDVMNHIKLDEDLFYRINKDNSIPFKHTSIIEVTVGGIKFKFFEKKS